MIEIAMFLAKCMTREQIVEQISKSVAEYEAEPSDDNWNKLASMAMLCPMKVTTESEDLTKIFKDMDTMQKGFEMLNPKDQ